MLGSEIQSSLGGAHDPGYRQVAESIRTLVLSGVLQPGARLPAVRKLASELGVTGMVVQRAYAELRKAGLVSAKPGSSTVVAVDLSRTEGTAILAGLPDGSINTFEKLSRTIGLRSMATAVPDPALFIADEYLAELNQLRDDSEWVWYYGQPAGTPELQRQIATLLKARGIEAADERIVVTRGSTGALHLVLSLLGRRILVERPTLMLGSDIFDDLGAEVIEIASGDDGLELPEFARTAEANPGSVLVVHPTFHPASGTVIPETNRTELLAIAKRFDVLIVEVDVNRLIAFEAPPLPLAALDESVIYIDSFSYCLTPGLRTGFIHAPAPFRDALLRRVKASGISEPCYQQIALARYLAAGRLQAHLRRVVPEYRVRRDAMLHSLQVAMPKGIRWTTPRGGFSTWVTLPEGVDIDSLYREALAQGVAFTPGDLITQRPHGPNLRLSYGMQAPAGIREAVCQLAELVRKRL